MYQVVAVPHLWSTIQYKSKFQDPAFNTTLHPVVQKTPSALFI